MTCTFLYKVPLTDLDADKKYKNLAHVLPWK